MSRSFLNLFGLGPVRAIVEGAKHSGAGSFGKDVLVNESAFLHRLLQTFRYGSLIAAKLHFYFAVTGALRSGNKAISMRRFWLRPAGVSLLATG